MVNDLAGVLMNIEDQPIAVGSDPELPGQLLGAKDESSGKWSILVGQIIDAGDVLVGHEENMDPGLRMDVVKGDNLFVLVADVGWHLLSCNPTEQTFGIDFIHTCLDITKLD